MWLKSRRLGVATAWPNSTAARADHKVGERQVNALSGLLGAYAANDLGCGAGHRLDGHLGLQFIEELAALTAAFGRGGAIDAVGEFGNRQGADRDGDLAHRGPDVFLDPWRSLPPQCFYQRCRASVLSNK